MAYKNQNYMRNFLLKEEADKFQKDYVDPNQQQQEEETEALFYSFESYADSEGNEVWGQGTVEVMQVKNDYAKVRVATNSTDQSFVNAIFYIQADAKTDGTIYQLYTDEGQTSANIYVKIEELKSEKTETPAQ